MWFALSGRAAVSEEGRVTMFESGQGMIVQTRATYGYEATSEGPHMLMWCESEPLSRRVLPELMGSIFPISPAMRTLLDLGLAAERRAAPTRDALALHLGHALLVEVMARVRHGADDMDAHTPAERLRAIIAAYPRQNWTPERMARQIGLSGRTLSRRLALDGAPTATELLWRARVRHGAELLVRSRASCADIADLSGFQNAGHFSRRIRDITGLTPTEIRSWAVAASLSERADFFRAIETSEAGQRAPSFQNL
jgi:AraC family transcriptional regulator of arabinose operon